MGMDVHAKRNGAYFRASIWTWHSLWDLCEQVCPDLCRQVKNAHTNDGDGLDNLAAGKLGLALSRALDSGEVSELVETELRKSAMELDVECSLCEGTGKRKDRHVENGCNGCGGLGHRRPDATHYHTSTAEVREFAKFCTLSGGFTID